jgi:hypothetical protein
VDDRLNIGDIRRGIVRSFFWPILLGELAVDLESKDGNWRIDAETLPTHRALLPAAESAVIEFANWASTALPAERIILLNPERAIAMLCNPLWKPGEIAEQLASRKELVTNHGVAEMATKLYYDAEAETFKRGAG